MTRPVHLAENVVWRVSKLCAGVEKAGAGELVMFVQKGFTAQNAKVNRWCPAEAC